MVVVTNISVVISGASESVVTSSLVFSLVAAAVGL